MTTNEVEHETTSDAKAWGCLIVLGIVIYIIYSVCVWVYGSLDDAGWISHQEETTISARSDWLIGESKECLSMPLDYRGDAMFDISCDDGPGHKMKITFYGRQVQSEHRIVSWRCTRSSDSFTCYQMGGH